MSRTPLLTREQECRLARAIREGGARLRAKAKDIFIRANLRLVFSVAKHYTQRGLELPDLIQEGVTGLMTAAERYDERRGTKFSTYAVYWIRQAIRNAIKGQSRLVRVPSYQWELYSLWNRALQAIYLKTGEPAREEAVLKRVRKTFRWKGFSCLNDVDMRSARRFLDAKPVSMETDDGVDCIPDPRAQVAQEQVAFRENLEAILAAFVHLTEPERIVIRCRFGLDDHEPQTLKEIGERMGGLTRERVRQIERDALNKLKEAMGQPVKPPAPRKSRKRRCHCG